MDLEGTGITSLATNHAVFHLDQEHTGVRYAIIGTLFLTFLLGYWLSSYLLRTLFPEISTTAILSCLGAVPISLLFAAGVEWMLKRTWHSGRTLAVDSENITLHLPEGKDRVIFRRKILNQLWWQLPLSGYARGGRERRMPAKWYCMAGQLQQDETRIVVYCYVSPKRRRRWLDSYEFEKLSPEDVYNTSFSGRIGSPNRPELPPEVIAGRQGRFWLAERNRWRDGVEMSQEDFEQFLSMLHARES